MGDAQSNRASEMGKQNQYLDAIRCSSRHEKSAFQAADLQQLPQGSYGVSRRLFASSRSMEHRASLWRSCKYSHLNTTRIGGEGNLASYVENLKIVARVREGGCHGGGFEAFS